MRMSVNTKWFCTEKEKEIVWHVGARFCQFGVQLSTGWMHAQFLERK